MNDSTQIRRQLEDPHTRASQEMLGRRYRYNETLDSVADLLEQGPTAWAGVHPKLLAQASDHLTFRRAYRAAVEAGDLPDTQRADLQTRIEW